ncbi:hypothetical protein QZH56_28860 [Streptomyces olivoreticuli]|uniref:hypothetical protein n=1 Tax=Streptomyces olivoreticuli TaxID=68246 RepID=UPI00265A4034|nr:hypothetical protein [Streptomyces olivoreticuli]WKK22736.1 hypothetical protein QZH56_28860 [Streptomyces olivoreticuli]
MIHDDNKVYFQAVTESEQAHHSSPAGSYCAGTLEQARAFAGLALTWAGVDQVRIQPWSVRAEVPLMAELHERDGEVKHYVDDWVPGPWPAEAFENLNNVVLS